MRISYAKQAQKAIERLDKISKLIPEDNPLPDEIASHAAALEEYRRGEVVSEDEINWD